MDEITVLALIRSLEPDVQEALHAVAAQLDRCQQTQQLCQQSLQTQDLSGKALPSSFPSL